MKLLIRLVILATVLYVIFGYGFMITQVRGQGMFPAMKDGDVCVIFRTAAMDLTGQKLQQDDVISYRLEDKRYFGRVVAVAGDQVQLGTSGSVQVNGITEKGEILFPTFADVSVDMTVEDGTVYVLGDYRTQAEDSRMQGAIPLEAVEGKIITILRRRQL